MIEWAPLILFAAVFVVLLLGYPVALTLAGTGLMAAAIGLGLGIFDASLLMATPNRVFGIISNQTLVAVPLFVFMGIALEQSRSAELSASLIHWAKCSRPLPADLVLPSCSLGC